MPGRPTPLPQRLADAESFSVRDALEAGVPRSRVYGRDLAAPFAGVRATHPLDTVFALARAYSSRLTEAEFFSHATAAVLHDMWVPMRLHRAAALDVSVFLPARAPRDRGVRGHHLQRRGQRIDRVRGGLPVLERVEVWCQLAPRLSVTGLIIAGDGLLTPDERRPEETLAAMRAVAAVRGRVGGPKLRDALELIRPRVRSPRETALRLLLVRAGLPEPLINADIVDARGRFLAEGDLVYPDERVLLEYEGDHHRTDRAQFRKDILRRERLVEAGWWTIRVTDDDLVLRQRETVGRAQRTLHRRRAS